MHASLARATFFEMEVKKSVEMKFWNPVKVTRSKVAHERYKVEVPSTLLNGSEVMTRVSIALGHKKQ